MESTMSGVFKTGRDGRKLFFPWGPRSTSFVIPTKERYWRLRLQVTAYSIVSLLLIVGAVIWLPIYVALVVVFATGAIYTAWTPYLVRGLELSAERMSQRDVMAAQPAVMLWLLGVVALAFVAGGVVMLIADPGKWIVALASIVLFGACAVLVASALVLRRRRAR
jgi:hypothetical protein